MKIVYLDSHALNPGDLSWDELNQLGDVTIYPRTNSDQVYDRSKNADIVLTNKVPFNKEMLQKLPQLKYIGITATGYNIIDIDAAAANNIIVTNVPNYSTMSVAQTALSLLLEITHHVGLHAQGVRQGKWAQSSDFAYWERQLIELDGLTLGIIGYGTIGCKFAQVAQAMGMKILAYKRTPPAESPAGITFCDLDQLIQQSDVVSLHCPLTDSTRNIIDAKRLQQMKNSAILLNVSRGGLVDEATLAQALKDGTISAAGLDVLESEPPEADNPLFALDNCFITPHVAWASLAARKRLLAIVIRNIQAFMNNTPENDVTQQIHQK